MVSITSATPSAASSGSRTLATPSAVSASQRCTSVSRALLVTIDVRHWWPDLGLGDALREPVPVVAGGIRQGPFRYEIADVRAGGEWTFRHDPAAGSFGALDVRAGQPSDAQVAASHQVLSTPPAGRFTRLLIVLRRDEAGAEALRGIRHQRTGDGAFTRDLVSYGHWRDVLGSLRVSLAGTTEEELRSLHARTAAGPAYRSGAVTVCPAEWSRAAARIAGRRPSTEWNNAT
jgi:hypothetical protein